MMRVTTRWLALCSVKSVATSTMFSLVRGRSGARVALFVERRYDHVFRECVSHSEEIMPVTRITISSHRRLFWTFSYTQFSFPRVCRYKKLTAYCNSRRSMSRTSIHSVGMSRNRVLTSSLTLQLGLAVFLAFVSLAKSASVACNSDSTCQSGVAEASKCVRGFCSNPFHYGGCLESLQPGWTKKRVCGSDDPPEAIEQGYCRRSPWEEHYMEIRILGQDWETSFFVRICLVSSFRGRLRYIKNFLPDLVLSHTVACFRLTEHMDPSDPSQWSPRGSYFNRTKWSRAESRLLQYWESPRIWSGISVWRSSRTR